MIADGQALIEQEVKDKSGSPGPRSSLRARRRPLSPRVHPRRSRVADARHGGPTRAVLGGLPDLQWRGVRRLPVQRSEEVSEALLSVIDAKAQELERPTIIKACGTVRGSAAKHVTAAIPALSDLVQKYTG